MEDMAQMAVMDHGDGMHLLVLEIFEAVMDTEVEEEGMDVMVKTLQITRLVEILDIKAVVEGEDLAIFLVLALHLVVAVM